MKIFLKIVTITILLLQTQAKAKEFVYILNDNCINNLYNEAEKHFSNSNITAIRDPRGIILRLFFKNPQSETHDISNQIYKEIKIIEYFLAKIENPAIIEVHTGKTSNKNIKSWEISTVIANNIESIITKPVGLISQERINSIGYGEFLPAKNTPNNGGKEDCRIDIIILCNISGE